MKKSPSIQSEVVATVLQCGVVTCACSECEARREHAESDEGGRGAAGCTVAQ